MDYPQILAILALHNDIDMFKELYTGLDSECSTYISFIHGHYLTEMYNFKIPGISKSYPFSSYVARYYDSIHNLGLIMSKINHIDVINDYGSAVIFVNKPDASYFTPTKMSANVPDLNIKFITTDFQGNVHYTHIHGNQLKYASNKYNIPIFSSMYKSEWYISTTTTHINITDSCAHFISRYTLDMHYNRNYIEYLKFELHKPNSLLMCKIEENYDITAQMYYKHCMVKQPVTGIKHFKNYYIMPGKTSITNWIGVQYRGDSTGENKEIRCIYTLKCHGDVFTMSKNSSTSTAPSSTYYVQKVERVGGVYNMTSDISKISSSPIEASGTGKCKYILRSTTDPATKYKVSHWKYGTTTCAIVRVDPTTFELFFKITISNGAINSDFLCVCTFVNNVCVINPCFNFQYQR